MQSVVKKVVRKPRRCRFCGGELRRIVYGCCQDPERIFQETGEIVVIGGELPGEDEDHPDWECADCGQCYEKVPFLSAKFCREAAWACLGDEQDWYSGLREVGFWQEKRVYLPIYKEPMDVGFPLVILVDRFGQAEYERSELAFQILDDINTEYRTVLRR